MFEKEQNQLRFEWLDEVLGAPTDQRRWLVDRLLPVGGFSILAGKPKVGKSTLARCLALAVARGERWLGFESQQAVVLYLALEEKASEVAGHFRLMGANETDRIGQFFGPSPKDGLAQLAKEIELHKAGLVVIDPLSKAMGYKDINEYVQVSRELEQLLNLARETGAHVMAVHHTGKGMTRSGGESLLGSQALFAAADTVLVLKRDDRYLTLSSEQRYGEPLSEMTVTLNPETRMFEPGLMVSEAREAELEARVTEYLSDQSEPVEEEAILHFVGGRKAETEKALRRLRDARRVDRTGEGRKGKPYLYALAKERKAEVFTIGGRGASLPPQNDSHSQGHERLSASREAGTLGKDNDSGWEDFLASFDKA